MPSPLGAVIVVAVFLGGLIPLGLAAVARRRPDRPGGDQFVYFALAAGAWNITKSIQFVAGDPGISYALYEVSSAFALFAGFGWTAFAIHYAGYGDRLSGWVRVVFWGEPAAYTLALFTRKWHGLMPPPMGPTYASGLTLFEEPLSALIGFQIVLAVSLTLLGFALIGAFALRTRSGHRKQAITLLGGGVLVHATNVVYQSTGAGIHPAFDPTSVTVLGMVVVIAIALFRYDLFSVTPLATDALFEEMTDPVFVIDESDAVIEHNEPAERLFGNVSEPTLEDLGTAVAAAVDEGEGTVTVETTADETRIYDLHVSPIHDAYDRVRGRLVVFRDVTVRKRRERELERQNEQLERFASVVSHDIRNPLTVAKGFTQQARDTGDVDVLDNALTAMDDMERLVDDVLQLAREGQTVGETQWVDLESVAADAWSLVDTADATLDVDGDGQVEADPDRLRELLGNLFRNSVEHAGPSTTVRVGVEDGTLYVTDDGPGIPEEDREEVFESGYSGSDGGTGLGLAIVEAIAEAHGWDVSVTDAREGGARFEFSGVSVREAPVSA